MKMTNDEIRELMAASADRISRLTRSLERQSAKLIQLEKDLALLGIDPHNCDKGEIRGKDTIFWKYVTWESKTQHFNTTKAQIEFEENNIDKLSNKLNAIENANEQAAEQPDEADDNEFDR